MGIVTNKSKSHAVIMIFFLLSKKSVRPKGAVGCLDLTVS